METFIIKEDIRVFTITAESFPAGILESHQKLHALVPYSRDRRYFGLSRPEKGLIEYKAAAEQLKDERAGDSNLDTFTIEKGNYRCITVLDYHKDIQAIGKAFEELTSYTDLDPDGYCLEWYYNDTDVKCMIRLV